MLRTLFKKITILVALLGLAGCQQHDTANQIKVGTITGPETKVMEVAKQVAKRNYGLDIKIVEFSDFMLPNIALNDGSIDANAFQHMPYLQDFINTKHFKLVAVAKTFIYPIGVYSKKFKDIQSLPDKAIIAVPNDPSNEARGLLLLEHAGLITLKAGANYTATPKDIIKNDKNFIFKEIDAAQLPRVLPDVDAAVINTTYAIAAGLDPSKDTIYKEDNASQYYNVIVTREDNKNSRNVQKLIAAFHSPAVVAAAKKLFNGNAIPAW